MGQAAVLYKLCMSISVPYSPAIISASETASV